MRPTGRLPILLVLWTLAAVPAAAAEAEFLETFGDWNVFTFDDDKGRTCYIASEPVKMEGNYSRRDPPVAMVAKFPIDPPNVQVVIQAGYRYKKNSRVEVDVDGRKFDLMTHGDSAYEDTPPEDEKLIEAMKKGRTMKVKGTSTKGTWSLDTYSLRGFTKAYRAMLKACRKK